MAAKRKLDAGKRSSGAKKAKAAMEYAAATEPTIASITPLTSLLRALQEHKERVSSPNGNVVHWFRSDLRLADNRALYEASKRAKENGKGLLALYVVSPQVKLPLDTLLNCRIGDTIKQHQFEWTSFYGRLMSSKMTLLNWAFRSM
jgi:DNA photolyase